MTTLAVPAAESYLAQLESLQDDVLVQLDALNDRIESLLAQLAPEAPSTAGANVLVASKAK